jgi:hypothetical protein
MKKTRFCCLASLVLAITLGVIGCATPQTISPPLPPMTNAVTGIVTPAVAAVVTNVPNVTYTKIAADGNAIAPLIPAPFGDVLTALLGVGSVLATILARKANGQLNTVQGVANSIIQGVESAGTAAAAVKQAVAKTAMANGNADAVETAVNAVTGSA